MIKIQTYRHWWSLWWWRWWRRMLMTVSKQAPLAVAWLSHRIEYVTSAAVIGTDITSRWLWSAQHALLVLTKGILLCAETIVQFKSPSVCFFCQLIFAKKKDLSVFNIPLHILHCTECTDPQWSVTTYPSSPGASCPWVSPHCVDPGARAACGQRALCPSGWACAKV